MKRIKLIVTGIIMSVLISSLSGCSLLRISKFSKSDAYAEALYERYNKEFTVTAMGSRFNDGSTSTYAYANDDPTTIFVARFDSDNEIVSENYAHRNACSKIRKLVCDTFAEYGIESICVAETSGAYYKAPLDISISEYIKISESDSMKAAIVAKLDNVNAQNLESIFREIGSQYPEILVGFNLYTVSDEGYEIMYEYVQTYPQYYGVSYLNQHGVYPINKLYVEYENGALSMTAAEIEEELASD